MHVAHVDYNPIGFHMFQCYLMKFEVHPYRNW